MPIVIGNKLSEGSMLRSVIRAFLPLFFLSFPLAAQTDTTSGMSDNIEIEVIPFEELMKMNIGVASFQEKNIFNTPSTVSVIDRSTIEKYNFTSVSEALNSVAGFSVMRTYLKRNIPTSRGILQDHYANKVLLLVNNTPMWNAVTGEGNLDRIDINEIERIEILKGPASVVYGTNAYSGAVNIVLRKSSGAGSNVLLRAGNHGTTHGGGNFGFTNGDYSVFVSANSSSETGTDFTFTDQANVRGSVSQYIKSSDFTLNLGYKEHGLLFNIYNVDESYLGVSPLFSSGAGKNHNNQGYMFDYSFKNNLISSLQIQGKATFDYERRELSRSFDDDTRAEVTGQRLNALVNFLYNPADNLSFQLGTEYGIKKSLNYNNFSVQKDLVLEENNMKNKTVYDAAVFGQGEYSSSLFDVLVGLRYNKNELFGGNLSSRGTLVYKINNMNSLKLVYGTSYRSPSLFELYFRTSTNTVFGNTELKPEESTSYELSYVTSFSNFMVQALGYFADYTNKIYRTTGTVRLDNGTMKPNVSVYTNGNKFSAKGVELEIKYSLPSNLDAFINYGYVKGNNGDKVGTIDHYNFKYVPEHSAIIGAVKSFGSFSISGLMHYISEQGGPKSPIAAQTAFDLNLSYTHKAGQITLHHNLSGKNITDREFIFPDYVARTINSVPSGFGRSLFYSLALEF